MPHKKHPHLLNRNLLTYYGKKKISGSGFTRLSYACTYILALEHAKIGICIIFMPGYICKRITPTKLLRQRCGEINTMIRLLSKKNQIQEMYDKYLDLQCKK